ncbi:MAG: hypothetical protein ABEJ78_10915 [Haloferacaceae archaeon]
MTPRRELSIHRLFAPIYYLPGVRPRAPRRNALVLLAYLLAFAVGYWHLVVAA